MKQVSGISVMLPTFVARSLQPVLRAATRKASTKMPDPYRESYSPFRDPLPIGGFFLVVAPLAWMFYDIAFQPDKEIEPK
ncbi:hypothetical protein ACTXT7_006362 [Hymenolepis weldensis]